MNKLSYSLSSSITRFCIEGNIGCGKTSILNQLTDGYRFVEAIAENVKFYQSDNLGPAKSNFIVSPEPIERWSNVAGQNLLGLMYKDPSRWSFTFENYAQLTRYRQMKSVHDWAQTQSDSLNTIHLLERSIFSNRFCFIENFNQSGELASVEYGILDKFYKWLINKPETAIDHFIYLQTEPEIVYDRIHSRSRCEEESVPLDYFRKVHHQHELLFCDKAEKWWADFGKNVPKVSVVNANRPLPEVFEAVRSIIDNAPN